MITNTYIVSFTVKEGSSHTKGQNETQHILNVVGVDWRNRKWAMGQGNEHHWKIKCTEEKLILLVLKGGKIERNITAEARITGLAKLTEDEKEALGLNG